MQAEGEILDHIAYRLPSRLFRRIGTAQACCDFGTGHTQSHVKRRMSPGCAAAVLRYSLAALRSQHPPPWLTVKTSSPRQGEPTSLEYLAVACSSERCRCTDLRLRIRRRDHRPHHWHPHRITIRVIYLLWRASNADPMYTLTTPSKLTHCMLHHFLSISSQSHGRHSEVHPLLGRHRHGRRRPNAAHAIVITLLGIIVTLLYLDYLRVYHGTPVIGEPDDREEDRQHRGRMNLYWDTPVPAMQCARWGTQTYSARLWNVETGYSWVKACERTPVVIHGKMIPHPDRCEDRVRRTLYYTIYIC